MFSKRLLKTVAQVVHDAEHRYDEEGGTPCDMCEDTAGDILRALVKAGYTVDKT